MFETECGRAAMLLAGGLAVDAELALLTHLVLSHHCSSNKFVEICGEPPFRVGVHFRKVQPHIECLFDSSRKF